MTAAPAAADRPVARLVELFSAIQGEGANVGTRQIFLRFGQCDLRCRFCDSQHTWVAPPVARLERSPGSRDFETVENPVSQADLQAAIARLHVPNLHDSLSLTGGEPLLHARFLADFLPRLRETVVLPVYLETGGHRPQHLQAVLPYLDSVGMDVKLPSASGETHWDAHADCLRRCREAGVAAFVKAIVAAETPDAELDRLAELAIATVGDRLPCFLQPVTPLAAPLRPGWPVPQPPSPERLLAMQARLKSRLKSVRVVPQTHKAIGQL